LVQRLRHLGGHLFSKPSESIYSMIFKVESWYPVTVSPKTFYSLHSRREPLMWGFLETMCHRYGLFASVDELDFVTEICTITANICSEASTRHFVQAMEDEEDARTVVNTYIARMTPKPDVQLLRIFFCATLVDFVFQETISTLGEVLVPLVKAGYERIWMELAEERIVRDVRWCIDMAQCLINTLGCTE
jgi:hypothetical protein